MLPMELLLIICSVAFVSAICHRFVRSYADASFLATLVSAVGGLIIVAISSPGEVNFLAMKLVFSGVGFPIAGKIAKLSVPEINSTIPANTLKFLLYRISKNCAIVNARV